MKNTNIKTVIVNIDKLKPAIYNPRKLSEEQERYLTQSIKQFGLVDPIIANKHKDREQNIIGGHQRYFIAQKLGYKEIPVVYLDLNEEQEKRLNLHLNHSTGSWDIEKLRELDIDLLVDIGFNDSELRDIWDDVLEIEDDDFNEEKELEKIKITDIKIGDKFRLGNHVLLCADSTIPENIKKLMGQEKTSLIYCDPVYNINLNYDKGIGGKAHYGGKTNDRKTDIEYKEFLRKSIINALSVGTNDLHIFYYCDQKYIGLLQELYASLRIKNQRVCLWVKNGFNVTPQIAFNKSFEPCVYGIVGKPYLSPIKNLNEILNKEIGTGNKTADDIMDIFDIWLAKRLPGQDYEHSTSKPPTLHEKPLRRCSKINDIVLDLFSGSGSTMIACEQLKRRAYMVEIEPIFCQLIINRFEKLTGIKAELIK
jgi:DNA modification methylase